MSNEVVIPTVIVDDLEEFQVGDTPDEIIAAIEAELAIMYIEELHATGHRVDVTDMSKEEMMKFF